MARLAQANVPPPPPKNRPPPHPSPPTIPLVGRGFTPAGTRESRAPLRHASRATSPKGRGLAQADAPRPPPLVGRGCSHRTAQAHATPRRVILSEVELLREAQKRRACEAGSRRMLKLHLPASALPPKKYGSIFAVFTHDGSFHRYSRSPVSLRLGHARALTTVQVVIHSPRAASLPPGGRQTNADLCDTNSPYK